MNQVFYTPKQLSALLQISVRTLHRIADGTTFPAPVRLGGSARWPRQEVEDFLKLTVKQRYEALNIPMNPHAGI